MDILLALFIGFAIQWVALVILIIIGQNLADLDVPPFPEMLWKTAVIVAASSVVTTVLDLAHPIVGWLGGLVIFWILMVKWFKVDLFGAVVLVVLSFVLRIFLLGLVLAALGAAMS